MQCSRQTYFKDDQIINRTNRPGRDISKMVVTVEGKEQVVHPYLDLHHLWTGHLLPRTCYAIIK